MTALSHFQLSWELFQPRSLLHPDLESVVGYEGLVGGGGFATHYSRIVGIIENSAVRADLSNRSRIAQFVSDVGRSVDVVASALDRRDSMRSYSQFGEDKVLRSLLPESFGTYLDIGAGHPTRNSNSYYFYKRGWRGVLVEPIASHARLCRRTRPRDSTKNCLVGTTSSETTENGNCMFWEFEPSELSTASSERAQSLIEEGVALKSQYECPLTPISALLPPVKPIDAFFVTIDVEGLDMQLLRAIDWVRSSPRVVCVEDADWANRSSQIGQLMRDSGYVLASQHTISSIYLHSSYAPK